MQIEEKQSVRLVKATWNNLNENLVCSVVLDTSSPLQFLTRKPSTITVTWYKCTDAIGCKMP